MALQQEIENLRAQVERNTTVAGSASQLISTLAQMIRDAADDPDEVRALADQVSQTADALSAAVSANTPTA
ncbi:MAG TPA: hypothetical protein VK607_10475 [Kofleriaceae bacterium]|nr:hypothetical protein [Kofleriaceae bacterium]